MGKSKRINIPIYNYPVILFFGENHEFVEYLSKTYKQSPADNFDEFANGYALQLEKVQNGVREINLILFVKSKDRFGGSIISTVNHESIHIAWSILEFVGIKLNEDNHEALTYLVAYISEEVMKNIDKWTKE